MCSRSRWCRRYWPWWASWRAGFRRFAPPMSTRRWRCATSRTGAPKKLMSLGEFELVYDDTDDLELVSGELTGPFGSAALPFPAGGIVGGMDTRTLMSFAEFELLDAGADDVELGYLVSRNPQCWLRPDLSLTRPDQPGERYYEGAPLVVFEVVSEYDTATRLDKKVADYLDRKSVV